MELAPVPRRRPWSVRARTTLTVLVLGPVVLLALVPAAFGLERYVMSEDAGEVAPRGSVVLARDVPVGDLRSGDVVTFAPSGSATYVSGTVQDPVRTGIEVEVGRDEVPLTGRATVSRLVVGIPLVGYPFVDGLFTPVLAVGALLTGLALGAVFLRDSLRPPSRGRPVRRHASATGWA